MNGLGAFIIATGFAWAILVLTVSPAAAQTSVTGEHQPQYSRSFELLDFRQSEGGGVAGADQPSSSEDGAGQPASASGDLGSGGGPPGNPVLLQDSLLEKWGQSVDRWKSSWPVNVTGGAYHWWHINNGGPLASGYGIPLIPGTYCYYLFLDTEKPVNSSLITKVGAHAEMRLRDSGRPVRPFFAEDYFWFNEIYGFCDTPVGRLKTGAIAKQFGLFYDDSWWGNVPYMDGLELNSAYGLSLENTPEFQDDFKVDSYCQLFFAENRVSGAMLGADSESYAGSQARNTLILRMVPTWKLAERQTFALGVSATVGEIGNRATLVEYSTHRVFESPGDQTIAGWDMDGTWTAGNWKFFAEVLQLYGVSTPCHYVSGGPSDRRTDGLAGISYTQGPISYRFVYSYGMYDNPYGSQEMLVPGITARITRNLTLWFEYTYWTSRSGSSSSVVRENGCQMIVNWHF